MELYISVSPADLLASLFALWCGRHDVVDGEEVESCGDPSSAEAAGAGEGAVICEQLSRSAAEAVISGHRDKAIPLLRKRSETHIAVPRRRPGAAERVAGADVPSTSLALDADDSEVSRLRRFRQLLTTSPLDVDALRRLSWSGVPMRLRASVWRVLSLLDDDGVVDDLPRALEERRRRYWAVAATLSAATPAYRQVRIDVPRMASHFPAATTPQVRLCLERVLLVWATLHPDAGYVQGMNDILAPVLAVLLLDAPDHEDADPEADAHACLARLLGGVRDFYTSGRPGVRRAVRRLEALVRRVDGALDGHLRRHGVDYMLFAFRWMNNLLTRELPLRCSARLWDTLLAEAAPQDLTVYLCAAFLQRWRDRLLLEKDFNGVVLALQDLPTHKWGGAEVDALLAEAYRLQAAFADAPSHLADDPESSSL